MKPASEIVDVDYRLIGLSPQYWSYTPLLIGDVVGLPLINGVDCFVKCNDASRDDAGCGVDVARDVPSTKHNQAEKADGQQKIAPKDSDITGSPWCVLPISRVLLKGIATAIDRRPNGCTLIVLDDGTGSIDCRYWDDCHSGNNAFNLPPLLPAHNTIDACRGFRFDVGDSLEVMGKIKTLTAGSTSSTCKLSDYSEVRFGCVREIHATSVCLIREGQTRMANQWNGEIVHWLKSIDFSQTVGKKCNDTGAPMVRNGKDVLLLLGETITSSILGDGNIGFSNLDKAMDNKSFLKRKCCRTPQRFRSALFYCHCEATLEPLDISFRFRDVLLHRLLDMEARLQHSSDSVHPSATEDCMDLFGASDPMPPPLLFTFGCMYKDEQLALVARDIAASTRSPKANAQRLVRKTFSAMVDDGILSLYNPKDDVYLLVSRARVIEPFLRRSKGSEGVYGSGVRPAIPPPFFIRSVPRKRIAEITNWIKGTAGK